MAQHLTRGSRITNLAKMAWRALEQSSAIQKPCTPHNPTTRLYSESRILSTSMVIQQDGIDFYDIPIVMCKTHSSMFPFHNQTTPVRSETRQEIAFKSQLQKCISVLDILRLLEIPATEVSGYSAAFALQRLSLLQSGASDGIQSFIRTAVLNELCETVVQDLTTLSNNTVIVFMRSCSLLGSIPKNYVDKITDEVERRVGESKFDIEDLCSLIELIAQNRHISQSVAKNIWIHLGNRYREVTSDNVSCVYKTLDFLPRGHKYLLRLLDKQLLQHWWKFTSSDVVTIMQAFTKLRYDKTYLDKFSKWLAINIHSVNDSDLSHIVSSFTYLKFSNEEIILSLERYVSKKIDSIDPALVAVIMEHCVWRRHQSHIILDAAALHFIKKGHAYHPVHMWHALRAFGELNYHPKDSQVLFEKVEGILDEKFSEFKPNQMLDLLCSFTYIERFPINFINKVFTPTFLNEIKNNHKSLYQLRLLHTSLSLEKTGWHVTLGPEAEDLLNRRGHLAVEFHKVSAYSKRLLMKRFRVFNWGLSFRSSIVARHTHVIDKVVNLDEEGRIIGAKDWATPVKKRLALMVKLREHTCINTGDLLGRYAMRNRHLKLLGYHIVEVDFPDVSIFQLRRHITGILQKHMKPQSNPDFEEILQYSDFSDCEED